MEAQTLLLVIAAVAVMALAAMLIIQKNKVKSAMDSVEKDRKALDEKEKILFKEAKIKALEELQNDREALNEEERERRQELSRQEQKLAKREDALEDKIQEYTEKDLEVQKKKDELLEKEDYLAELVQKQTEELERISGMSTEEAKNALLEQLKNDLAQEQMQLIRENEAKIKETSLEKAQEILSTTMQRCMIEQVVETTVSVVALPNDEMKGRIIGREGRNIRALETLTGVDLIIDDTPEAVVLSSFDPVRREIAKLALEKLIVDGRIHPVRIEEMVAKAKEEIDKKIWTEGENAALEMGVMGLNKELIKTLGRLYYRTSYGQNVLKFNDNQTAFLRSKIIGFVFQQYNLLNKMTATDNVALPMVYSGGKNRKEKAQKLLSEVGLSDRVEHKPTQLSGGQQQRVAIARSLVNDPKIIFADEPTGNLDPTTASKVFYLLMQYVSYYKCAIMMATHNMELAYKLNRQVTLANGNLLEVHK